MIKDFKNWINENVNDLVIKMEEELSDIENSEEFKIWLKELGSTEPVTREMLINGYCEDLAFYLHFKYGAEIWVTDDAEINDGHYFVKLGDKFYDGMDPKGYPKPSDSTWSQRVIKNSGRVTPEIIMKHLKPFDEKPWSGYTSSAHVIKNIH